MIKKFTVFLATGFLAFGMIGCSAAGYAGAPSAQAALPLTVDLWHPAPDFARAFRLKNHMRQFFNREFTPAKAGREVTMNYAAFCRNLRYLLNV